MHRRQQHAEGLPAGGSHRMSYLSVKRPVNARWFIRHMDRLHWRTESRYKTVQVVRGTTVQFQVIRDRRQAPLLHKGKKP